MTSHPHLPPAYSRRSSSGGNRNPSVTEASLQNLSLGETAASQHLSPATSYGPTDPRCRRPSYPPRDQTESYFRAGYDPDAYDRESPSERPLNPYRTSPAPPFDASSSDHLGYPLASDPTNFNLQPTIPDSSLLITADMG